MQIKKTFTLDDLDLKDKLVDAIYRRAIGYEIE